ncbi:hypothetical protein SAV14893_011780 [Streptomyces avermitilis]|uniref:Amidohydrolase-related domain-containing protein n=1 Tax=Streptomyces avermitilis TaxID=33903 RepID=A0A4D4LLB2_STRAX|nr:hypothetical protein SAVMC3_23970 [Streptomyces avermitilis]GDY61785.1 hypothetical protein SAV14893_011780 [Streptomyces avermitilis]
MAAARRIVIENCAIATVDADDTEYASGHIVVAGGRIESLGAGKAPRTWRTSYAVSTPPATS